MRSTSRVSSAPVTSMRMVPPSTWVVDGRSARGSDGRAAETVFCHVVMSKLKQYIARLRTVGASGADSGAGPASPSPPSPGRYQTNCEMCLSVRAAVRADDAFCSDACSKKALRGACHPNRTAGTQPPHTGWGGDGDRVDEASARQ
jgi:hypothetical protein